MVSASGRTNAVVVGSVLENGWVAVRGTSSAKWPAYARSGHLELCKPKAEGGGSDLQSLCVAGGRQEHWACQVVLRNVIGIQASLL